MRTTDKVYSRLSFLCRLFLSWTSVVSSGMSAAFLFWFFELMLDVMARCLSEWHRLLASIEDFCFDQQLRNSDGIKFATW